MGCLKTISFSLSSSFILATSDFCFSKNVGVQIGVGPWLGVTEAAFFFLHKTWCFLEFQGPVFEAFSSFLCKTLTNEWKL